MPEPIETPVPQPFSYQFQYAFLPSEPPLKVSVVDCPLQRVDEVAPIATAGEEVSSIVIVFDTHLVVLQVPSALNQ